MSMPLLSVLLPCRNGGRTLAFAIRSVLGQTFDDFELLLLNDGSSDDSVAIARSFGDARVRILGDGIGRGLPCRLNEGVAAARGRYIARMDADDVCFPERFARQVAFLDASPEVDLVGCRAVVFRDSGEVVGLLPFASDHDSLCARPWRNIPLAHPTWMGRRTWFTAHLYRIPEVYRAEDQELLLRSYPDSRYACLDDVLLGYRQGSFQLQRTLVARRALLAAQLGFFFQRGQWCNLVRATALSSIKIVLDSLASLPGCERLFFMRMRASVATSVKDSLRQSLVEA